MWIKPAGFELTNIAGVIKENCSTKWWHKCAADCYVLLLTVSVFPKFYSLPRGNVREDFWAKSVKIVVVPESNRLDVDIF